MFEFNISPDLIKAARKQLRKNIDSQHPVVQRFQRHVEKNSLKHFKIIWATAFFFILFMDIFFPFGSTAYFDSFHIGFILTILLVLPALIAITTANVLAHFFYKRNHVPIRPPVYIPSSTNTFSSSSVSSLSINPASGLPMCGSVDISGNAPGYSRHY